MRFNPSYRHTFFLLTALGLFSPGVSRGAPTSAKSTAQVKSPAPPRQSPTRPSKTNAAPARAPLSRMAPSPQPAATPAGKKTLAVPPRATGPKTAKPATARPQPVPGRARLFDPATLFVSTLPNGVRAVIKETQGTGLVAVQVWVRAGSRYESISNNGVAHLIEDVALRASKNYPHLPGLRSGDTIGGGATDAIAALGGNVNSQTSRDATFYSATVASTFWPAALRALADATLAPTLTDSMVEESRSAVQSDVQQRKTDPVATMADLAYETAFSRHPYRRPAGGTEDSIDALTGAAVRAYHKARYIGPNISVIVVGDVHHTNAHALIAQYFGAALPGPKRAPAAIPVEQKPLTFKTASRRIPTQATMLALAFRAPGINSPKDVVAMDTLLVHWGEGSDAGMRRVLLGAAKADKPGGEPAEGGDAEQSPAPKPLALGFDVDFLTQRDPGLFIVSLVVEPDRRTAALSATLEEIGRVNKNGIDAAALQRAKRILTRQYIEQGETVSGQAGALGFYEMIADYRFAVTYLDSVAKVTMADVKRVAGRYLSKSAYVQAVVEPLPRPRTRPPGGSGGTITARAR